MLRFIVGATIALLSSTAAQADWYRASSKHFVVYSDDSERDVRDYTTQLEQFDQAIRRWHVAPENPRGESDRKTNIPTLGEDNVRTPDNKFEKTLNKSNTNLECIAKILQHK